MNPDAIPAEVREREQWLMWDASHDTPRRPHWDGDFGISWSDPDDWHTFEEAVEAAEATDSYGIGYVIQPEDPIYVIDLDSPYTDSGHERDWLPGIDFFEATGCYIERSPSGNGIHIPVRGDPPEWWRDCEADPEGHQGVECLNNKFCSFTGDLIQDGPILDIDPEPWLIQVYENIRGESPDADEPERSETGDRDELSREEVEELIGYCDNLMHYNDWIRVGYAVHSWDDGKAGRDVFESWSRKSSKFDSEGERVIKWIWNNAKPDGRIGVGTLVHYAKEGGWQPPKPVRPNGGSVAAQPGGGSGPDGPIKPTGPGNLGQHQASEINPTAFFNDDGLFKAYSFAKTLLKAHTDGEHTAFATDEKTETIYFHSGRSWSPRGEQVVRKESRDILTDAASAKRVNEVVKNVKVQTYSRRGDIVDLPPEKIVVRNGIVDLIENEFSREWDYPGTLSWVDVEHRAGAEPEQFEDFLYDILPKSDVPIMWEVIGLCLYRGYPYQRAIMLLGEGANGKSTLLKALRDFLGPENIASMELQHLARRFGAADLEGKLANLAPDIDDEDLERSSTFKALTGGDEITVDRKHKTSVRFVNTATLLFSANRPPAAEDDTHGYERRWLYFKFPNRFDEDDPDTVPQRILLEKFREEHPGILNKATEAFARLWERGGFEATTYMEEHGEAVHERTTRPVAAFVQDKLEPADGAVLRVRKAYGEYREWAKDLGHPVQGRKAFERHVRDKYGCEEGKDPDDGRLSVWIDLQLSDDPDDQDKGGQAKLPQ